MVDPNLLCIHGWPIAGVGNQTCLACQADSEKVIRSLGLVQAQPDKPTGGRVNYYLVHVAHPQREDQKPYQAECEDIIEALELNPDEANIFKEIWRSAAARQANGKPGHTALYGAEKMVHYAGRILRRLKRQASSLPDRT